MPSQLNQPELDQPELDPPMELDMETPVKSSKPLSMRTLDPEMSHRLR